MTPEYSSHVPLEGQSMQDVVHHIMDAGAKKLSADFGINSLRASVTNSSEPLYGNDPTKPWNRALMTATTQYWQRAVLESAFSSPSISGLMGNSEPQIVNDAFIGKTSKAARIIREVLFDDTKRMVEEVGNLAEDDKTKQLFSEYQEETRFRATKLYPRDERALPIATLISQGTASTLSEAVGLLKVHAEKHKEEGKTLTSDEASILLTIAAGSHVGPLLKSSSATFDMVRRHTRDIRKTGPNDVPEYERGEDPTDFFHPDAFVRTQDGRIYPKDYHGNPMNLHLPTDKRFRDRQGCPAGYPSSMTNEFYPGHELSRGGPAISLYLKFAEVVKRLKA